MPVKSVEFKYRVEICWAEDVHESKIATVRYYPREDFASLSTRCADMDGAGHDSISKASKGIKCFRTFSCSFRLVDLQRLRPCCSSKQASDFRTFFTYLLRTLSLFLILYVILVCIVYGEDMLGGAEAGKQFGFRLFLWRFTLDLGLGMWEELVA